jgi:hydrophobe/amphiphile efflux-1 (HAE1) family protein
MVRDHSHGGGLAAWSIRHPVGVSVIALAVVVLGLFALGRLSIDLLPHIIYPEVRVRILEPGVPATVMEDRITRQLEEQLAITEDAVSVQSQTSEGATRVDLAFEYGKDIDIALRDASTRLDRAKRFLPTTIDPPVIYKRDPSQIPVAEYVISSSLRNPVELRTWVDDVFRKWFLNLPGVAAVEVGGGLIREIHVLPDQARLAAMELSMQDLIEALQKGNRDDPAGRLQMSKRQLSSRISGRFTSVRQIAEQPLVLADGNTVRLGEIARVIDTHEDERLRVRLNGIPGIKVSIQKQPSANTVAVVDAVQQRLALLQQQALIPNGMEVLSVADQSIYIRHALNNSSLAAVSGGLLAMLVVYLFLGNLRRTLIIGSAIPIAIMVTFVLMGMGGLTLNIMTLGGLALGVGMLVDNTIVMLENISRHQQKGESMLEAGVNAAREVNSAIVAATSTNLAAVLPFLFVGGLVGLLFRELIFTISAAIVASMIIALTLVPALASRVKGNGGHGPQAWINRLMGMLQRFYLRGVDKVLRHPLPVLLVFLLLLALPTWFFNQSKPEFLPKMDDGRISINIRADAGISLETMDQQVNRIEEIINAQPGVDRVFTISGGRIFGRTEREIPNYSTLTVQLVPRSRRDFSSGEWINMLRKAVARAQLVGIKIKTRTGSIRGIRISQGDDDISLRIQGPDLKQLETMADGLLTRLGRVAGLRNLEHSSEEKRQELAISIDRERAAALGLDVEDLGRAMRIALQGVVVTDFLDGDRAYDVRLRLPQETLADPQSVESVLLFPARDERPAIYLGNVADVNLVESPADIYRDNQQRIIEISGSVAEDFTIGEVMAGIDQVMADFTLPEGYSIYDGGVKKAMQEGRQLTHTLLILALFLVFVVMAVQYESLRNPLVIIIGVPFASVGVVVGLLLAGLPVSTPVWLGMIMLAGIVVNNAIVMVEYIEILRERGQELMTAIREAAGLRLRPILMTTLTTVAGMLPLALGLGEGAEMLQPLAVVIVYGLSFSMLVSLLLIPALYRLFHQRS